MSVNRENVTWQSADGTWSRGFFHYEVTGEDYEWDVEYDFTEFGWVRTGFATVEAADDSWDGSNPGQRTHYRYEGNEERCDGYDAMAREALERSRDNRWFG
jgi:hypothetical protein